MRCQGVLRSIVGLGVAMRVSGTLGWSQGGGTQAEPQAASQFLAPATQVVAVRAGRLFDVTSGTLLTNQVVLIRGDRIADVGPAVEIPPEAIVDEAHRLGLRVACHTYGGEGLHSCLRAGVDAPQHAIDLDDASLKMLVEQRLPLVMTLDDLIRLEPADMRTTGGKTSRLRMAEQSFRRRWPPVCRFRWERCRGGSNSARQAGQPVCLDGEMGNDPGAGIADGHDDGRRHPEL